MIIYKITNKINGKTYIGQTTRPLNQRWNNHKSVGSKCRALKSAIKKYGTENFVIEEIDGANNLSELNYLETHYIYKFNSLTPNGYNMALIKSGAKGTQKGVCIVNIKTEQKWDSIEKCVKELNINRSTLCNKLYGFAPNDTDLRIKGKEKINKKSELHKRGFQKGKNHKMAKKIINTETLEIFNTVKIAAEKSYIRYETLLRQLSGFSKPKTNLIYLENYNASI